MWTTTNLWTTTTGAYTANTPEWIYRPETGTFTTYYAPEEPLMVDSLARVFRPPEPSFNCTAEDLRTFLDA